VVDDVIRSPLDTVPTRRAVPPLVFPAGAFAQMIGHMYVPCANVAASARVYSIDPREHLRAERAADDAGLEVIGVVHSHTHSEPYPSPTDVAQAPDPGWHYVIVSLKRGAPESRSYRIVDGGISEEPISVS
jgi:[CysO sulfur-carrier protein]-S-L-cysteine hydrolase